MSVLGHRTMAEAERYTRNASQTMLRRPRLEARNGTSLPKPAVQVWENAKKEKKCRGIENSMALPRGLEPLFSP